MLCFKCGEKGHYANHCESFKFLCERFVVSNHGFSPDSQVTTKIVLETAARAPGGSGIANDWEFVRTCQADGLFDGMPPLIAREEALELELALGGPSTQPRQRSARAGEPAL